MSVTERDREKERERERGGGGRQKERLTAILQNHDYIVLGRLYITDDTSSMHGHLHLHQCRQHIL